MRDAASLRHSTWFALVTLATGCSIGFNHPVENFRHPFSSVVSLPSASSFIYTDSFPVYILGAPVSPTDSPVSPDLSVVLYSIFPSLPAGLVLDPLTGEISGTPTTLSPTGIYSVTATKLSGTAVASLTLAVVDVPPLISYSTSPASYRVGVAISSNLPTSSGGIVLSYSISPILPAGLAFNTATGEISGTPSTLSAAKDYTVTAFNSGGSGSAIVNLEILTGPVARFAVTNLSSPASIAGGSMLSATVAAQDSAGDLVSSYTGTVTLSSSDPNAALPSSYAFVAGDAGLHSFSGVHFNTTGLQTVIASGGSVSGVSNAIQVNHGFPLGIDPSDLSPCYQITIDSHGDLYLSLIHI